MANATDKEIQMAESPLLLGAAAVGRLLGVSLRQVWSLHQIGSIPLPLKLRGRTLWSRAEIERWIEAGCPKRERWLDMKKTMKSARDKKIFLDSNIG